MSDTGFQLHERLAADTVSLGQGPLSDVLLMNDSHWLWVLLVPRVADVREIYELAVSPLRLPLRLPLRIRICCICAPS